MNVLSGLYTRNVITKDKLIFIIPPYQAQHALYITETRIMAANYSIPKDILPYATTSKACQA